MNIFDLEDRKQYYEQNRNKYLELIRSEEYIEEAKFNYELKQLNNEIHDKSTDLTFEQYFKEQTDFLIKEYDENYLIAPANCREEIYNIDLTIILSLIRENNYESALYLFISDNQKIKKIYQIIGTTNHISTPIKQLENLVKEAKDNDCNIYTVHNHPDMIAALPSGMETKGEVLLTHRGDFGARVALKQLCDKYEIHLLDDAVVTPYDYYSALEMEGRGFLEVEREYEKIANRRKHEEMLSTQKEKPTWLWKYKDKNEFAKIQKQRKEIIDKYIKENGEIKEITL